MSKEFGTAKIIKSTCTGMPLFYLRTSSSYSPLPSNTRKRNERSDSIRLKGFEEDYAFNWRPLSKRTLRVPSVFSRVRKTNSGRFVLSKDDELLSLAEAQPTAKRATHSLYSLERGSDVKL